MSAPYAQIEMMDMKESVAGHYTVHMYTTVEKILGVSYEEDKVRCRLALQPAAPFSAPCAGGPFLGHSFPAFPSRGRRRNAVRASSPLQPLRVFRSAAAARVWPPVGSATRSNGRGALPHPSAPQ